MNKIMDIVLKTRTDEKDMERVEIKAATCDGFAFLNKRWGSKRVWISLDCVDDLLEQLDAAGLTLSFEACP